MNKRDRVLALVVLLFAPIVAVAQSNIQVINPPQGPIAGGTQITLEGSGFAGTTLTLDGVVIAPTSASDTQIVFQTPPHDNGIASISLRSNSGFNAYAEFLYLPPSLQSLPPGYITTVMGIGVFRGDGRLATNAMVDFDGGIAIAGDGSVFISEHNQAVIRRVRTDGVIERYAGTGVAQFIGDGGPAIKAGFSDPRGIAIDPRGNLLVADSFDTNAIRRIDVGTGVITTIYGQQSAGFSGDGGAAANAKFNFPTQIAFDTLGNLYVLDLGNVRIRKIDTQGTITTIAGSGAIGFSGDGGPATQATFDVGADSGGLAVDSLGNVYLADTNNGRVRRIEGSTGVITTFIANAGPVRSVIADRNDNVYIGMNSIDSASARILKLSSSGQLLQSWGKGSGFSDDGMASAIAPLCQINRLALDLSGNLLFAEDCSNRIRRINIMTGVLDTFAGIGPHIIGETGPALATVLNDPGVDLLSLASGDMLIAEAANFRVRRLDQQGNLSAFSGNGFLGGLTSIDNIRAVQSSIAAYAVGLAQEPNGDVLVTDTTGIYRIDSGGIIHALTAVHQPVGFAGDGGPANTLITAQPWDVATDSAGNVFIADSNNNRIRRIDATTGTVSTVAGSGPGNGLEGYGKGSYCGDGGLAAQACLNTPYGVAIASDGTMYIGENGQRVRKVTPNGTITTFFSGGGGRVRLAPTGNLFMTPFRIQPNGHAFQFAFNGPTQAGNGDGGAASQASGFGSLQDAGIAVDTEGNLFLANGGSRRIRAIRYGAVMAEPGSTVTTGSGSPQTTATGTTFTNVLRALLLSPVGTPENGIRIDFAAPASGASCTFAGGNSTLTTLTDVNGYASVTCTANSQSGSYSVTATPLALAQSASFALTNASTVTMIETGLGSVTINPGGISCGTSCSTSFAMGTTVTLSATPGPGQNFLGWSGACSGTALTCTITIGASTSVRAAFTGVALNLVTGWNLVGNSSSGVLDVATAFSDAVKFTSVWKWIASRGKWAFYAPSLIGQALTDYATGKDYDLLTGVIGGEGFWINAKLAGSVNLPNGNAISVATLGPTLVMGWNLVSVGETATPKQFCDAQSSGVTTLWAWDGTNTAWYFYAPSLDASGGLVSYITSKGYLDFTAAGKELGPGLGFWVNRP